MKKNTLFQLPKKFALHFTASFFILYKYTVYKYIYLFLRVFLCPEHYHCCQWLSIWFMGLFSSVVCSFAVCFRLEHSVRMTFITSLIFIAVSDDRIFSMMDNLVSLFSVCSTREIKKKKGKYLYHTRNPNAGRYSVCIFGNWCHGLINDGVQLCTWTCVRLWRRLFV